MTTKVSNSEHSIPLKRWASIAPADSLEVRIYEALRPVMARLDPAIQE